MRVEQIKAYKSNDGCIWETEKEAVEQNIDECIGSTGIEHSDNYSAIVSKLKEWFRNHSKDVRYIQANIKKI